MCDSTATLFLNQLSLTMCRMFVISKTLMKEAGHMTEPIAILFILILGNTRALLKRLAE